MTWRRVAAGVAGLCVLAGLIGVLALRGSSARLVVGSVPIGDPRGVGVDSRLGRAFILDDDVRAQQVTLQSNGWTSSGYTSNNKLRVIDTRTGRLVKAIDVSQMAQSLTVDRPRLSFRPGPGRGDRRAEGPHSGRYTRGRTS